MPGKYGILFILLFLPLWLAVADEETTLLESPVYVPEVLTFFNRELQDVMSYGSGRSADEFIKSEWYTSIVYEFDMGMSDSANLNFLGGFHFCIGPFRIPVFTAMVTEVIDTGNFYSGYLGFFGGSGLVYDNQYFSLGTFAGYYDTRKHAKYDSLRLTDTEDSSFSFTLIPIVYTGEMLYLNIMREILLRMNATLLGINDIAMNFRFRQFPLFNGTFGSSVYYLRESYASIAKNNVYGAKISIAYTIPNLYDFFIWELSLEGGYRDFFNSRYDQYVSFDDTMFIKAGIDLIRKNTENIFGFRFNILFDRQNLPKAGVYLVYRLADGKPFNGISGGELGKFAGISFKVFQEFSAVQ